MSCDKSWLELLESSNSSLNSSSGGKPPSIVVEDCDSNRSRELKIEFADSENEKKFDKLLNENKLKSPFKRHLSDESLTESSVATNSQLDKKPKLGDGQSPSKRFRKDSSESSSTGSSHQTREFESDPEVLARRQKQIDFGKNTNGYDSYIEKIPRAERVSGDPKTPPKHLKYSRRAWDGLIKSWRKKLHKYDPSSETTGAE